MNCPTCGKAIRGRALFCPHCGQKVTTAAVARPAASVERPPFAIEEHRTAERRPEGCRRTMTVLILAGLAFLAVVGLGIGAVHMGLRDRQAAAREAAAEHLARGTTHLNQQEYELAVAEFGMALQLDPSLEEARQGLEAAQERLEGLPVPTSQLQDEMCAAYLNEMTEAYEREDWPTVFGTADRLLAANPTYRREEVDRLLFEALYQSGQQLVAQERITEALRLFDRALLIQPDEERVTRARTLATHYITGLSYWDTDWALVIDNLARVHDLDPAYCDVRLRLAEAREALGEQLAAAQDWCGAEEQYALALDLVASDSLSRMHDDAAAHCVARALTPTVSLTPGALDAGTPTPAGTYVGRVVRSEEIGSQQMFIRGHVLDEQGIGVGGVAVTIRAWDWSVTSISDGQGQFSFDGLANPVTYTISLADLPSTPLDVAGEWGKLTWISFQPAD
ncbi:MAG TPA: hypothetical protein GX714_05925 [Chloroflexi bacterium]|jgi:tetratricopeptide (TPR) repeat protein|nr:hypothetical protein [Chloroflexota bacterium]